VLYQLSYVRETRILAATTSSIRRRRVTLGVTIDAMMAAMISLESGS
jgi:hypothetical protein